MDDIYYMDQHIFSLDESEKISVTETSRDKSPPFFGFGNDTKIKEDWKS